MNENSNKLKWTNFYETYVNAHQEYGFIHGNKSLYFIANDQEACYNVKILNSETFNLLNTANDLLQYVRICGSKINDIWDSLIIYENKLERFKKIMKVTDCIVYNKQTYEKFVDDLVRNKKHFTIEYINCSANLYTHNIHGTNYETIVYLEKFNSCKALIDNASFNGKKLIELWDELK